MQLTLISALLSELNCFDDSSCLSLLTVGVLPDCSGNCNKYSSCWLAQIHFFAVSGDFCCSKNLCFTFIFVMYHYTLLQSLVPWPPLSFQWWCWSLLLQSACSFILLRKQASLWVDSCRWDEIGWAALYFCAYHCTPWELEVFSYLSAHFTIVKRDDLSSVLTCRYEKPLSPTTLQKQCRIMFLWDLVICYITQ